MYKLPTENLYRYIKKIFLYTFLILVSFNNFSLSETTYNYEGGSTATSEENLGEDVVDELINRNKELYLSQLRRQQECYAELGEYAKKFNLTLAIENLFPF